ncbi:hypothetical protein Spb1_10560 [Planctopirus ephydatiae]|uniref:Uncharacterized protein n=1 Tax=Planctopirus ephydatiae TaxID=2528019 RepID=A0A518GKX2_9PLAN|nr:hypothetical protein Spb1_10560 [Planctopirus ephydatiae]
MSRRLLQRMVRLTCLGPRPLLSRVRRPQFTASLGSLVEKLQFIDDLSALIPDGDLVAELD